MALALARLDHVLGAEQFQEIPDFLLAPAPRFGEEFAAGKNLSALQEQRSSLVIDALVTPCRIRDQPEPRRAAIVGAFIEQCMLERFHRNPDPAGLDFVTRDI